VPSGCFGPCIFENSIKIPLTLKKKTAESKNMGSCLMRDYIQTQDAIIEELRRDVQELRRDVQHSDSVNQELRKEFNNNQEELRQLKNLLTQPKNDEELAILRTKFAVQEYIKDLKQLVYLQNEIEALKQAICRDPEVLEIQLQKSLHDLQAQLKILQDMKQTLVEIANVPPYASLLWEKTETRGLWKSYHCTDGFFAVEQDCLRIRCAGFYIVLLNCSWNASGSYSCSFKLLINGVVKAENSHSDDHPNRFYLIAMLPLQSNDRITISCESWWADKCQATMELVKIENR